MAFTVVDDIIAGLPNIITFKAGADVVAGQVVGFVMDDSQEAMEVVPVYNESTEQYPIGVALDSKSEDEEDLPVAVPPSLVRVRASSNKIEAGKFVRLADNSTDKGHVDEYVPGTDDDTTIIGQAYEDINASGTGRVKLGISFAQI